MARLLSGAGSASSESSVTELLLQKFTGSMDELKNMEATDPEAANIFHRISVLLLSERVMHLTRTVRALELL